MNMRTIEKIKKRIGELEEIATGSKLDWEGVIYSDRKYEVTLLRDYYDEQGFYLIVDKQGDKIELKELPKAILEEALLSLESVDLEEAIRDTVNET